MRVLRNRDENAPPQLPAGKTIHQRNKSTPALSTLMQVGGIKAAATKRTVFADVSNMARQPAVKDDMQIPGKRAEFELLKDPAIVSAKEVAKPAALLRPAQRPLTTATTKLTANHGSNGVASAVPRHVTTDACLPSANIRKVLSKKATTVFKEPCSDPVAEVQEPITTTIAGTTRQALGPRSKSLLNGAHVPTVVEANDKTLAHATATSLLAAERHVTLEKRMVQESVAEVEVELREDKYEYLDALEEQARVLEQERNDEIAKSQVMSRLDPEEYWDEEEEEEYYDADGYTTARSLRSRGDNTTGGVTLVLAPRITSKSQRELESAKQYVDSHKSPEDVEDEQWDTSMVAEYGDEIFEYMHDLEVSIEIQVLFLANRLPGTHETQCNVHGSSSRDTMVDALRTYGLACSSSQPLHLASRDLVPGCQLR